MPRLQILQHKSYHPYLEKNKQRVREDEARAQAEEQANEQLRVDTEAEARLNVLRRRAGSPSVQEEDDNLPSTSSTKIGESSLLEKHRKAKARAEKEERKRRDRLDFDFPSETAAKEKKREARNGLSGGRKEVDTYDVDEDGREAMKWETGGHLNLFADLEKSDQGPSLQDIAKSKAAKEKEDPYTMYLARPDRETKPWYTDRDLRKIEDREVGDEAEERRVRERRKDIRSKDRNDPLTHITTLLSSSPSNNHHKPSNRNHAPTPSDPHQARAARESSERQRALALIAKSKAATSWDQTPSSVGGGRNWAEDLEKEKDRAGRRFFAGAGGAYDSPTPRANTGWGRPKYGRSWEV